MTNVEQRNFSDFEFGDNVYALADGLIPEIAERLNVSIGKVPNSDNLQAIMEKVGPNKVLRDNAEIEAIGRGAMVDFVERSQIQAPLSRSLWTPETPAFLENVDSVVLVGGVANWQDRAALAIPDDLKELPIYNLGGSRVMDSPTEKPNPSIMRLHSEFYRYPTEAEYAASVITPKLVADGQIVMSTAYATASGDEILDQFFEANPLLLENRIAVIRVANAGVLMAIQLRNAARRHNPNFDNNMDDPQTFVVTDTLPIARTKDEEENAAHYQKAATALRQIVLTAKKLFEATGA